MGCLVCRRSNLANNTAPAVVDSNAGTIDDASPLAVSQISTDVGDVIHLAHGGFDGSINRTELFVPLHVHPGLEYISDVGVHAAHHEGIALDTLVAIECRGVLRQADKTVFTGCVRST